MKALESPAYAVRMPPKRPPGRPSSPRRPRVSAPAKTYPNRIHELTKATGLTYAKVGDRLGVHEITINKLSRGSMQLTHEWMRRLAPVYGVSPAEIIEAPPSGMRRVKVTGEIQAGQWRETFELPPGFLPDVLIPDDAALRHYRRLYAGIVRGGSMNLHFADGSIVIMTEIGTQYGGGAGEIAPGRRYHVRRTRADGLTEHTLKTLVEDPHGRRWLKPESSEPEHQEWLSLEGAEGETIELLGRVVFAVQRLP